MLGAVGQFFGRLLPKRRYNRFIEAFYKFIAGTFAQYDANDKTYINEGYLYNPDVYSVIQQQSRKAASIPWRIRKIKNTKSYHELKAFELQTKGNYNLSQSVKKIRLQTKAMEEDILDIPLEVPNTTQTWPEIKALMKTYLKCTGNIFLYKPSPEDGVNAGVPRHLYVLPSHLMAIVIKQEYEFFDEESPVKEYMLREGNTYMTFPAQDVIHIKYSNPNFDLRGADLYGLSPLRAALRNIQSSNLALDGNMKTMLNSGAFGFIHGKGNELTEAQSKELKSRMKEMDASNERLGKISGMAAELAFTRIALTTDELKPFDFLKYDQKAICNVLGWSDLLLNNDARGDYGGTIGQIRKQVISDDIIPDNDIIDAKIQKEFFRLFKGYEDSVLESVYDDLPEMQEDIVELSKWLNEALDRGVITRDEYRRAIKYPVLETPEMMAHTVLNDVIPLSEAIDEQFSLNDT